MVRLIRGREDICFIERERERVDLQIHLSMH